MVDLLIFYIIKGNLINIFSGPSAAAGGNEPFEKAEKSTKQQRVI